MYIRVIDCTHMATAMKQDDVTQYGNFAVWHIKQLEDNPYYQDMLDWMKKGKDIRGNKYND